MNIAKNIEIVDTLLCPRCSMRTETKRGLTTHLKHTHKCSPEEILKISTANRNVRTSRDLQIHQTFRNNMLVKYGVDHQSRLEKTRDKTRKTCVARYGVPYVIASPTNTAARIQKFIEIYGGRSPNHHPVIAAKIKATTLAKNGGKWFTQTDEWYEKTKATNREKYGADFFCQSDKGHEKFSKCTYQWKDFVLPSGKKLRVQGYEGFAITELLKFYSEDQIVVESVDISARVGKFWYMLPGESARRRYFPDIYIIPTNTIVEVKSVYTYSQQKVRNAAKRQACIDRGFNFAYIVFNPDSEIILNEVSQA